MPGGACSRVHERELRFFLFSLFCGCWEKWSRRQIDRYYSFIWDFTYAWWLFNHNFAYRYCILIWTFILWMIFGWFVGTPNVIELWNRACVAWCAQAPLHLEHKSACLCAVWLDHLRILDGICIFDRWSVEIITGKITYSCHIIVNKLQRMAMLWILQLNYWISTSFWQYSKINSRGPSNRFN